MAGTGKGQEDQLLTTFLNTAYDLDMKYVPFKGGGRVAKELAGKNANSTVNNPSEQLGFYEAGKTRRSPRSPRNASSCSPTPPRSSSSARTSCTSCSARWSEPRGMSAEAATFYQDLFAKVFASDEWQKYRHDKSLYGDLISGDELKAYWNARARHPRSDAERDRRNLARRRALANRAAAATRLDAKAGAVAPALRAGLLDA